MCFCKYLAGMNKNVQIEVFTGADGSSAFLVLPDNSSITVKRSSAIFGRGDIFSYNFRVSSAANRHVAKNAATAHGELLRDILQDARANLYVYGSIYSSGFLRVGNKDFDEDGDIDLSFYGGRKSFDKMTSNKNANDIPLLSKVQVGWAHDRMCKVKGFMSFGTVNVFGAPANRAILDALFEEGVETVRYPKFVVVKGSLAEYMSDNGPSGNIERCDFTNTFYTYDDNAPSAHPYCNIPVAYTRYVRVKDTSGKYEDEKVRQYHVSDAGRVNSAPNFFVMYWLRALFTSLGITITENQMAEVEDLTRLFFVNTNLRYDENDTSEPHHWEGYCEDADSDIVGKNTYNTLGGGGMWCTGIANRDDCKQEVIYEPDVLKENKLRIWGPSVSDKPSLVGVNLVQNNTFYPAYATPKNFPGESVDSVLETLEKAFGVRFVFSEDLKSVRIVLMKKVLTSNSVNKVNINITGVSYKQPEIKGLRWKYGSDGGGVQYNYPPFERLIYPRAIPEDTGYTIYDRWDFTKTYPQIVDEISDTNATCYVDPNTGNAYRIAVDKDTLVNGTLLEVAAYEAAIDGDVDVDDEYIQEETIGFTPLQMNRIDGQYALYVGDDMKSSFYDPLRPEGDKYDMDDAQGRNSKEGYGQLRLVGNVYFKATGRLKSIQNKTLITVPELMKVCAAVGFSARYPDNYDYDGDKDSPIDKAVDGFSLCLLRGAANPSGAITITPAQPLDDPDAVRGWELDNGAGVNIHPDSCTEEGQLFDYTGIRSGVTATPPDPTLERARKACRQLGIDLSWAPKLAAATPRYMKNFGKTFYQDYAADVFTSYDACASIMYCTSDAYVRYGDTTYRLMITPLRDGGSLSYQSYKDVCEIVRSYFAQVPDAGTFEATLQAAFALMAHSDDAEILEQIIPIYDITENNVHEKVALFSEQWRFVMYGRTDIDPNITGRFSLKLRAEKLNPFYDPNSDEPEKRKRYLDIDEEGLRRRGFIDVFLSEYKEYLLYGRTATFDGVMSYEDFLNLDELGYNEIGGCVGIIKNLQATLGGEEVKVKIELLYL